MTVTYPLAAEGHDVEDRAGLEVADPYRWLEATGPEVSRWQKAQNLLTAEHLRRLPQLAAMRARVDELYVGRPPVVPRFIAGAWWRIADQCAVVLSAEPFGAGTVLVDRARLAPDNPSATLSWVSPPRTARSWPSVSVTTAVRTT